MISRSPPHHPFAPNHFYRIDAGGIPLGCHQRL
jgi:hypothetical protein